MGHNITKCRSCGADIIFITTENGRKMPCGRGGGRLSRQHQGQRRCCYGRGQSVKSKHCAPDAKRTCAACRRQRLYAALGDVSVCK